MPRADLDSPGQVALGDGEPPSQRRTGLLSRNCPARHVLNFAKGRTAYCATLAVHPDYQKTRVNILLIRAMGAKLVQEEVEECRFLVEPGNTDARSIHHALGARVVEEVRDFYGPGDVRLWSVITKEDLERVRARYTRLRLVS